MSFKQSLTPHNLYNKLLQKKYNKNSEALLDETERYAKQIITTVSILFVKSDIKPLTLYIILFVKIIKSVRFEATTYYNSKKKLLFLKLKRQSD